ncbi:hypothetical protein [Streptomyces erythrochromogenes]|uniref:hypothetical protein n=1 Tax=Streptomyces erythrochromogenes TaxID=285574 RepID=UPI00386D78F3|nr:hypothetical protein OG364_32045 [Streptomyces erythrochromogenes]
MDPHVSHFFRTQLGLELAYSVDGSLRPTLLRFSGSYMDVIRTGFAPDPESLKAYLRAMHAYLFEDASQQPMPPA